jgi:DNA polymerase I-like protein with 3'-5' exonuclease and polymerase domains
VVGVSVSVVDGSWYFPIRHLGGGNMDVNNVVRFLDDLLSREDLWIVGTNLQYECEGLDSLGIGISGKLLDVQLAEALLDEERWSGYDLDTLALDHLGIGKDETLLKEAASAYGIDPKSQLWKLPSWYVGPYAEWDSMAPLRIIEKQLPLLKEQNLLEIFEIESRLLPLLWQMRRNGIPVDLGAAEELDKTLARDYVKHQKLYTSKFGGTIDEWSGPQIAAKCDELGLKYPHTVKGNPSFEGDWLDNQEHPFFQLVADLRELSRFKDTFVKKLIFENQIKGRIHCQWKQLANDEGGTRTGRMANANPNIQQTPAGKYRMTGKPSPIGQAIRAMFRAPKGEKWLKMDWSQQEPRILTHFAALCDFTGAKLARMAYQKDPMMDFYKFMMESANIDRRPAKDMYLGRCYGMGIKKMAKKLNCSEEEARRILGNFDEKVPFVKQIAESCSNSAQKRGYIKTLLGRRRHFTLWEPMNSWQLRQDNPNMDTRPLPLHLAQDKWPKLQLQRANTHKALNALIQGSAADMIKAALLKIHDETGIVPWMAVHDEIDMGVKDDAQAKQCQEIAEHCVDMTVPIRIDAELGDHWK